MKRFLSWLKEHAIQASFVMFVIIGTCLTILIGCTNKIPKVEDLPNRFEILEEFDMGPKHYRVIRDLGTNVLYLVGPQDIELLVDYKGDPVTWDPFGG